MNYFILWNEPYFFIEGLVALFTEVLPGHRDRNRLVTVRAGAVQAPGGDNLVEGTDDKKTVVEVLAQTLLL